MSSGAKAFLIIAHHWRRAENAGKMPRKFRKRYPEVRDGVGDFRKVNDRRLKLLIYFRRLRNSTSIKPVDVGLNACQINRNCIEIDRKRKSLIFETAKTRILPIFYGPIKMFVVHVLTMLKREINREMCIPRSEEEGKWMLCKKRLTNSNWKQWKCYGGIVKKQTASLAILFASSALLSLNKRDYSYY